MARIHPAFYSGTQNSPSAFKRILNAWTSDMSGKGGHFKTTHFVKSAANLELFGRTAEIISWLSRAETR